MLWDTHLQCILKKILDTFQAGYILIHVLLQKLLYSALAVALAGRCDEEILSLLLTLPANGKISLAVKELCSLPALDLYTMITVIAQNLNLRYIIYKVRGASAYFLNFLALDG